MIKCLMFWFMIILFFASVTGFQVPKESDIPCSQDTDCLQNSFCSGNTAYKQGLCSCTKDYVIVKSSNSYECLKEADLFGDPCVNDVQCQPKFGEEASCENKKCKCKPTAHFINLKCWASRKLGETCNFPENCIATEHSKCNGICSCLPGYLANGQKTKCLKVATNLGDACEENLQCTPVNPYAFCIYNVCLCQNGFTANGNTCTKTIAPNPYPLNLNPPIPNPPNHNPAYLNPRKNSANNIQVYLITIVLASLLIIIKN